MKEEEKEICCNSTNIKETWDFCQKKVTRNGEFISSLTMEKTFGLCVTSKNIGNFIKYICHAFKGTCMPTLSRTSSGRHR
ncbi:hypothetical protein C5167_035621 [Papaver somniferum]|uniref:Uncharacterized protein n=1 Tax=Papaver somniferum TaxID=3469 RepID=A0A4Y7KCB8_PAPSO|nr:hypothetical protein C5167_035621 [Papaver somniferum]